MKLYEIKSFDKKPSTVTQFPNIRRTQSGINAIIWVGPGEYAGKQLQHWIRAKVSNDGTVPRKNSTKDYNLNISGPKIESIRGKKPSEYASKIKVEGDGYYKLDSSTRNDVKKFIIGNYESIFRLWLKEIDGKDFSSLIIPIQRIDVVVD